MSESIFEVTFKKYASLTLEAVGSKKKEMTDEQNAALKSLYLIIRDCIEDISKELRQEKINLKNCETRFPKFLENYVPKNPYITVHNYETCKIQVPKSVRDCFKDLNEELSFKIVSKDKNTLKAGKGVIAKAGLLRDDDYNIKSIIIRFDILIEDINELKACIQHELQHIHMRGKVEGLQNDLDKFHGYMEYLGDPSEINAHSKEYAYRYHKKYPRDVELNFDKLKKLLRDPKYKSFNTYVLFGEDEKTIKDKHSVNSADIKKMKKIYDEFVDTVKRSLYYYL